MITNRVTRMVEILSSKAILFYFTEDSRNVENNMDDNINKLYSNAQ